MSDPHIDAPDLAADTEEPPVPADEQATTPDDDAELGIDVEAP